MCVCVLVHGTHENYLVFYYLWVRSYFFRLQHAEDGGIEIDVDLLRAALNHVLFSKVVHHLGYEGRVTFAQVTL